MSDFACKSKRQSLEVWKANWIWDNPNAKGAQHRYFRKEVIISSKVINRAIAYISADEYYKLYINGKRIAQGNAT